MAAKRPLPLATRGTGPGTPFTIHARGYEKIAAMATLGHDIATIAAALGCSKNAFNALRKRDERVQDALDRGHAALSDELVNILLAQARKGNVVAAIFLSKARCGWRETGPSDSGPKVNVQINLPAAMNEREYAKLIDTLPVTSPNEESTDQ